MAELPKHIALIGVGLMGGSIALGLKERGYQGQITGISRRQETLNTALKRGMLDHASTAIAEGVRSADMIILSTPLSTYGTIAEHLKDNISPGTIITDVGSVKHRPIRELLDILPHEHHPLIVPGHPIAGTEQSGPEAALSHLYENRTTILTPYPFTDETATRRVKTLWESLGSNIIELDIRRHDFIYAAVSHVVQLISFSYALALLDEAESFQQTIAENGDELYHHFIRLTGSDASMWTDIFIQNQREIANGLDNLNDFLQSLNTEIKHEETPLITKRIEQAKSARLFFRELVSPCAQFPIDDTLDHQSIFEVDEKCWIRLIPYLLSLAITESIDGSEYSYGSGSGLRGMTLPLISHNEKDILNNILKNKEKLISPLESIIKHANHLMQLAEENNAETLHQKLSNARRFYSTAYPKR